MIYLDHAAAAPILPEATAALSEASTLLGHPGSVHAGGRRVRARLERARHDVALLLGCAPRELRWASSASDALDRIWAALAATTTAPIACAPIEHPSLRAPLERMRQAGRAVDDLAVREGSVVIDVAPEPRSAVGVSALHPELGTVPALGRALEETPSDTWFVVDVTQAAGWMDLRQLVRPNVFLVCASAKLGGPPGVAAWRCPPGLSEIPEPRGTPPWLGAIAMGAAATCRVASRENDRTRVRCLAERLLDGMTEIDPGVQHNAGPSWLGPIVNVSFPGVAGRMIEAELDLRGVCIGRTTACQQRLTDHAPTVARAFPEAPDRALGATRWSLGPSTSIEAVDEALRALAEVLSTARRGALEGEGPHAR